jgi:hypothetical protein
MAKARMTAAQPILITARVDRILRVSRVGPPSTPSCERRSPPLAFFLPFRVKSQINLL